MRSLLAKIIGSAFVFGQAFAADPPTIKDVHALDRKCEAARMAKLKPILARKVQQCVVDKKRDDCAIFYSTYGNNSRRFRGLFYDLPQCVAATKTLHEMQAAQSRQ
jgi:hypothetical protein